MDQPEHENHEEAINALSQKIDQLLEQSERQEKAIKCIKANAAEINEMLTIWRHGKATFWTFYGAGKVAIFISTAIGAVALLIQAIKLGAK